MTNLAAASCAVQCPTCGVKFNAIRYYAALLHRRGPHIASHSVCLSVCPSVCLSIRPVRGCTLFTFAPSYERTSKIEKLWFSIIGQRHVCTFRHAQWAAYRTAISAAQACLKRKIVLSLFVQAVLWYFFSFLPARRYASADLSYGNVSVRPSVTVSKRLNLC